MCKTSYLMDKDATSNYQTTVANIMYPQATLKLARSVSDQNTVMTYVCLVNDITPSSHAANHYSTGPDTDQEFEKDEDQFKVERTKALHELVDSHKSYDLLKIHKNPEVLGLNRSYGASIFIPVSSGEDSDVQNETDCDGNPNIVSLTKMKWLTEDKEEAPDSSTPSISPSSSSSTISKDSQTLLDQRSCLSDRYLTTILRLDKEHNLFGLSNIAIVGSRTSKKTRKDEKPAFPQTAIVQICCKGGCGGCCYRSNTDLPESLKACNTPCGGCKSCCGGTSCTACIQYCSMTTCCEDPCYVPTCSASKCYVEYQPCCMKVAVHKKPIYKPEPAELTPRSSSVLQKPASARICHHSPRCIPPSSCFPYLMPCYWPARAGAPCSNPARCFHNPPCRAPRKPKSERPVDACPRVGKCEESYGVGRGSAKSSKEKLTCKNHACPGKIPEIKAAIESRFK